jgi:hypothetical protein
MSTSPSTPQLAPWKRREAIKVIALGTLTALLYLLLFLFSDHLLQFAAATRQGEKMYALVPLAIALLFSFVHGAFTGQFWDLMGLKAKK